MTLFTREISRLTTLFLFALLLSASTVAGLAKDYLTISSDPTGASIEMDGRVVGKTPYTVEVPGAYFHGTSSVFGLRHLLREQMHIRIALDGYLPKESNLASGPFRWRALN